MWPFNRKCLLMINDMRGVVYCLNHHPSSGYAWGMFGSWSVQFPNKKAAENFYDQCPSKIGKLWVMPVRKLPAPIRAELRG